jgi:uncharacterized membrane protein YdfJ with MMPL/SSD domain
VLPPDQLPLETPRKRPRRRRSTWSVRITPGGFLLILVLNLIILAVLALPLIQMRLKGSLPDWLSPVLTQQARVFPTLSITLSDPISHAKRAFCYAYP